MFSQNIIFPMKNEFRLRLNDREIPVVTAFFVHKWIETIKQNIYLPEAILWWKALQLYFRCEKRKQLYPCIFFPSYYLPSNLHNWSCSNFCCQRTWFTCRELPEWKIHEHCVAFLGKIKLIVLWGLIFVCFICWFSLKRDYCISLEFFFKNIWQYKI